MNKSLKNILSVYYFWGEIMMEVSSLKTKKSNGASKITNENKLDVQLPVGYKPSADEEFMNPKQIEYFRQKLLRWRQNYWMTQIKQLLIYLQKIFTGLTKWTVLR